MATADTEPHTVIIGAGIIGLSTAFYLSQPPSTTPPHKITLLDSAPSLFESASGYAGGFLARDWFGPPTAALGALSFDLHRELAEQYNGRERWGWSRSTGTSLSSDPRLGGGKNGGGGGHNWLMEDRSRADVKGQHEFFGEEDGPAWLVKKEGDEVELISRDDSTGQVDPRRLCEFLLEEVKKRGVTVRHPVKIVNSVTDGEGYLRRVKIEVEAKEELLKCQRLLVAAGAWTPKAMETLLPGSKKLPITSLAGHSLVVRSPRWKTEHEEKGCHAVFATDMEGFSPEVFSRIGGEIYLAGLNDASLKLPDVAGGRRPDPEAISRLRQVARRMMGGPSEADDLEVVREGLCYRPVAGGSPICGRMGDLALGKGIKTRAGGDGGVYVAAGHGPWGISQSLGTGKVMAELIEARPTSANIRGLKPCWYKTSTICNL